jgi:hypothetical protein
MSVSVKAEWIERYNDEIARRDEAADRRAHNIERGLLVTYAVSLVGASALIYASM